MHSSMSPKGVEHSARALVQTILPRTWSVHSSMSPKGVEHWAPSSDSSVPSSVHSSMSPKGVEHVPRGPGPASPTMCIHQCRRKALSTCGPGIAHHGPGKIMCIHQCRRKALSTSIRWWGPSIVCVHSSMSPKGVEHLSPATRDVDSMSCIHQCRRKALSTACFTS